VDYTDNNATTLNQTNGVQPISSFDYVIGRNSEAAEVPTGFDHPDNDTDHRPYNVTDVDPVGSGASWDSDESTESNETGIGSNEVVPFEGHGPQLLDIATSESDDVLDSSLSSRDGAYHVEGKVLYAAGDDTWKLRLSIEHNCENGTIKVGCCD